MRQIDLKPGQYRWRRPLSLPLAWFYIGVCVVMLGWIYVNKIGTDTEFFLTAMMAFCAGIFLAGIMRNID